ncbi:MotA/TolQ/ExbB proton channel family protein [Phyllobacterium endophyticum]|uniref:MotA/TolQ/ExbB proton channel family protein n=1 Tax=Phyllobacterium endophyticum TaxID=1149773 RepID=UPI0011CCD7D1|nr:MotA/TolQ/ExbB proton channel family protein [Phyllobacterium endophyticum]TXR49809.1 MotA/TolQ/ExbB proton channel family protein [Phyllobacterium endophyticum]
MQEYGFIHLWTEGDGITKAIASIMSAMSVLSWAVILHKSVQLALLHRRGREATLFWQATSIDKAEHLLGSGSPYAALVDAARETQDADTRPRLASSFSTEEWLQRALRTALDEQLARLQNGLAILASIGTTAPFVGLFGTVWGIYHALLAIGTEGQPSIDKIAGPVGESLVMTAFGLAVAIPAVLGYNILTRGNRGVARKLHRFSHDIEIYFLTGSQYRPKQARKPRVDPRHPQPAAVVSIPRATA